jgi:hypothetical protein
MITLQSYTRMLKSPLSAVRLSACEQLCAVNESSPEIIFALEKAACDENSQVASAAQAALRSKFHQAMAAEMGRSSRWMLKVMKSKHR